MLSEYRHTLGSSAINRTLQRSSVEAIFETSIDLVITQELRYDGGVVVGYCPMQCGVVDAALNIQIHSRAVQKISVRRGIIYTSFRTWPTSR